MTGMAQRRQFRLVDDECKIITFSHEWHDTDATDVLQILKGVRSNVFEGNKH